MTACNAVAQVASGDITVEELVRDHLAHIAQRDAAVQAWTHLDADAAIAAAQAMDKAGPTGPLAGLPIAVKDLIDTGDMPTTYGSAIYAHHQPATDADVVADSRAAGGMIFGKSVSTEFAWRNPGPTRNPHNPAHTPGGSSSGSAAAVAADLCAMATGTDTGGSIRQPAAFCGVTGFKPSYGRISRWGMIAFASSLDQAGPICKSAEDAALMLNAMAGLDTKDSTSADVDVEDYTAGLDNSLEGLRIGLPRQHFAEGLSADVEQAVRDALRVYEKLGAELVDIDLPNNHLSVSAYYVVAPAEASANLSRFDGVRYGYRCEDPVDLEDMYKRTRSEGFGEEVKRRIMVGTYALSAGFYDAYYRKAQKIRRLIKNDFDAAFKDVDIIIGPTSPHTAFKLGAKTDPVAMYLEDIYTIAVNLAGLPGMSVPVGLADGLPVGMHMVASDFAEAKLLNVAHQFQKNTDWHRQRATAFTEGQ
ncbi:MAG TPA: Asp-tRNA(Asn)/Glu-tRNA(Gln) amidotransferase GatCAB subunit A [Gammaproteobacteria bacterium]|nr:Asp-tRNA(Asn)/Glu-tRNA(Gln) amidotransferase GatCAB subunit A [Gammaproteobacteria bacterium]